MPLPYNTSNERTAELPRWLHRFKLSGLVRVGEEDVPTGSVFLPKPYRGDEVVAALRVLTGTA
jgi:hypothetical protein